MELIAGMIVSLCQSYRDLAKASKPPRSPIDMGVGEGESTARPSRTRGKRATESMHTPAPARRRSLALSPSFNPYALPGISQETIQETAARREIRAIQRGHRLIDRTGYFNIYLELKWCVHSKHESLRHLFRRLATSIESADICNPCYFEALDVVEEDNKNEDDLPYS
ncbi:uncharacterized protein L3040_003375 [Drepanopeziza brunnea f. sp. 'multigermtubi']|uniref:uncharacterized protein n=1 Tax=Drepanopeziza brunnea f. sp. 'multigermtubi' TaxID=698441 RepID=UPI00239AA385|nr:hypothetical protein L3040_003375 [Drepanopeziza brunnea f. sp. 'multigermtubi']